MDKLKLKEYSNKLFQLHIEITGFYNEFAKSQNLTLTELKVLHIIYKNSKCNQQMITQQGFLPKQTVNVIIKGFLKKGIIELSTETETDKRNKTIILTHEGNKLADNIIMKLNETDYKALNNIGEKKIKQLLDIITMYKENLKIENSK